MMKIKNRKIFLLGITIIGALAFIGCQPPAAPAVPPQGPAMVDLGTAGNYVILAKTAISNAPTSAIVGDLGLSPTATAGITGLNLTLSTGFATSAQVTGRVYAADMAAPTPANLTAATGSMQAAYLDASGRALPDFIDLGSGIIGGLTLTPGLYRWNSAVTMPTSITISGGANDTWIFQVVGALSTSASTQVILTGGAKAKNIVWAVSGAASLGATSHFEGILLCQGAITVGANTSMNGRLFTQGAVTLSSNTISQPAP